MSDIKYEVAVEYQLKGSLKGQTGESTAAAGALGAALARSRGEATDLGTSLRGLRGHASDMGSAFQTAGRSIENAFTGAVERAGALAATFAMVTGGAAIGAIGYGVAGLNSQLEKTKIALADILTSNGVTSNLTQGLKESSVLMAMIRKDAAALPGETSDLAEIFKMAAIPGLRAGATPERIEKLSAVAMAFGMGTAGLDGGTTARELNQLMSGRAGAHNVLGMQLAGLGGGAATSFNKMSDDKRLDFLEKALAKHQGSIELYANSFEGLESTMKDNAKLFLSNTTSPLFASIKNTMAEANDWFTRNQEKITGFTTDLGQGLVNAWERGTTIFQEWLPAIESFAVQAYNAIGGIWQRIEPVVARIGNTVRTSLGDGSALRHIESILKLYGEVKLARGVGGALSPLSGIVSAVSGGGGLGGLGGAGGALGGVGGAAAGGALALAATVAAGEMIGLANGNKDAIESASRLSSVMGTLSDDVSGGQTGLSKFFSMVGAEGTLELAKFFEGLHGILDFGDTASKISDYFEDKQQEADDAIINQGASGNYSPEVIKAALGRRSLRRFRASWNQDTYSPDRDEALDFSRGGSVNGAAGDAANAKKKVEVHATTNITNNFTISSNHDPSRIARDVMDRFAESKRNPTQSPHVRQPTRTTG